LVDARDLKSLDPRSYGFDSRRPHHFLESLLMALPETIAPALLRALEAKGYSDLTPVQSAMLGEGVGTADLLVSAQTGSGKTVAFGMAIADNLLEGKETLGMALQPKALIVAPTRELALQVRRELEWLYAGANAKLASCVGGMEMRKEIRALQQGAHIVVGTPGRLRDHISRGSLDLEGIKAVVLDEADEMLDLGFREDLEFILDASPKERRTLMFSATVPAQIAKLAGKFQNNAMRIATVSKERQHADIEYRLMPVAPHERENAIINALLFFDSTSTMVFCATRDGVKHLASRLANRGFGVVSLSGELSQAERTNALQSMRDGRARVCVATDVAARGIDLPSLDLVIHADLPTNPDTLLHRSGRTGRAGRKGICILVSPLHRRRSAERLLSLAKVQATIVRAPSQHDIQERDRERMLGSVTGTQGSTDEIDTVTELLKRHSQEAIALAYIRMVQASRPMAEELSETHIPESATSMVEKEIDRFENGVWFRLPQGRKHNVEPRWLIPTLCKAGHLTKRDIGFIRLLDHETRFEVRPEKADSFLEALSTAKGSDKGLRVTKFVGDPSVLPPRAKSHEGGERPKFDRGDDKPKTAYVSNDRKPNERAAGDWAPKDKTPKDKQRWSKDQKAARPKPEGERPVHFTKPASDKPRDFEPKKWDKPKASDGKSLEKPRKPFKGKPKKSNG
jgi:ATP-dependent RNA helicase DeaD